MEKMNGTATQIKMPRKGSWAGDMRMYRLDPPYLQRDFDEQDTREVEYVMVSAAEVPYGGGPETYIFEGDGQGEVANWSEMDGSFQGELDHEKALLGLGYRVVGGEYE